MPRNEKRASFHSSSHIGRGNVENIILFVNFFPRSEKQGYFFLIVSPVFGNYFSFPFPHDSDRERKMLKIESPFPCLLKSGRRQSNNFWRAHSGFDIWYIFRWFEPSRRLKASVWIPFLSLSIVDRTPSLRASKDFFLVNFFKDEQYG